MKKELLLAIDVGNTNITFGVFKGKELIKHFRMTTKMQRTSDEFGVWITTLLRGCDCGPEELKDVIIASVVPGIMHSLNSGIIKYLHCTPIVIGAGTKTGLRINMANPKELGHQHQQMRYLNPSRRMDGQFASHQIPYSCSSTMFVILLKLRNCEHRQSLWCLLFC